MSVWEEFSFFSRIRVPVYSLGVWGLDPCSRRLRRLVAGSSRARRGVVVNSVPWGLLVGVSRLWRCAIGIADQGVVWVVLCHWDC